MISAIGSTGTSRPVDQLRSEVLKGGAAPGKPEASPEAASAPLNPAAELAAQGAPIDTARVDAIKAALAAGTYRIDPQAIASKMMALDLPVTAQ